MAVLWSQYWAIATLLGPLLSIVYKAQIIYILTTSLTTQSIMIKLCTDSVRGIEYLLPRRNARVVNWVKARIQYYKRESLFKLVTSSYSNGWIDCYEKSDIFLPSILNKQIGYFSAVILQREANILVYIRWWRTNVKGQRKLSIDLY